MVVQEPLTCQVIRVCRPDTLMVRTHVPQLASSATIHLVLEGVKCRKTTAPAVVDWVEIHQDWGRLALITFDWIRDSYGRVLGDLADRQSGETLTAFLLQNTSATPWPDHHLEVIRQMMHATEPGDVHG